MSELFQNGSESDVIPDEGELLAAPDDPIVPCSRLIGCAGSGKTYTLIHRAAEDRAYGILTSTTGISAVNLGAITVHSTLGYSDTYSLRDAYLTGRLARKLREIGLHYRRLIIEEYSMLHGDQLDIIYRGTEDANRNPELRDRPLGILLVGDLAQLPPVKGPWVFTADCWGHFEANTERLTHVYRQDGGPFLDALNFLRAGKGQDAAEILTRAGIVWNSQRHTEFDGTTILPTNAMVARHNSLALSKLPGNYIHIPSRRWGKQRTEWGENLRTREWGIPPRLELKIGALVMILANAPDFSVVNGDTGYVREWNETEGQVTVDLLRTGKPTTVSPIVRAVEDHDKPDNWPADAARVDELQWLPRPHYVRKTKRYVLGQIEYMPLRLAYASTVHKSQSLTLDRVQVDFRDRFFSEPAMLYVALSRCRTLDGLRLVGDADRFAAQCHIDERTVPWI